MRVSVLKGFRISDDGLGLRHLEAGTEDDVPDALFAGLAAEGFVSELPIPTPAPPSPDQTVPSGKAARKPKG